MNPKQFLMVGGVILIIVGVLGFFLIGPTAQKSIFGASWYFDSGENWAHLIIGIVGVLAAYVLPASGQKPLVMLLGLVGVLIGIYSVFNQKFLGSNLENPADTILHIAVGAWALYSSMSKEEMSMGGTGSAM